MHRNLIRVAADSFPDRVAGAIAKTIRLQQQAEVQAIGADAVNQMIKSVILAQQYLDQDALQIKCVPSFVEVDIDSRPHTAIHLMVLV
jgi:stage V sporulation protein S